MSIGVLLTLKCLLRPVAQLIIVCVKFNRCCLNEKVRDLHEQHSYDFQLDMSNSTHML